MNQANAFRTCVAAAVLLSGCTRTESDHFVFVYAPEQPLGSLRGQSMEFFERALEERSDNRIQVELYCGGVLGTERELMDLVATGALQGTRGGFFADANPKFNIVMMPFLVDGWDQAIRLVNSDFVRRINEGARANGWHIPRPESRKDFERTPTTSVPSSIRTTCRGSACEFRRKACTFARCRRSVRIHRKFPPSKSIRLY